MASALALSLAVCPAATLRAEDAAAQGKVAADQNQTIQPGAQPDETVQVKKIRFVGNTAVSSKKLKKETARFLSLPSPSGGQENTGEDELWVGGGIKKNLIYDPDRQIGAITDLVGLITTVYEDKGYIETKVHAGIGSNAKGEPIVLTRDSTLIVYVFERYINDIRRVEVGEAVADAKPAESGTGPKSAGKETSGVFEAVDELNTAKQPGTQAPEGGSKTNDWRCADEKCTTNCYNCENNCANQEREIPGKFYSDKLITGNDEGPACDPRDTEKLRFPSYFGNLKGRVLSQYEIERAALIASDNLMLKTCMLNSKGLDVLLRKAGKAECPDNWPDALKDVDKYVDLIVRTDEKKIPVDAGIDYNNYGSDLLSRHRFGAKVAMTDPWYGFKASIRAVTGQELENSGLMIFDLDLPDLPCGTSGDLQYLESKYSAGGARELEAIGLEGMSTAYRARIKHPVVRTSKKRLDVAGGWQYRYSKSHLAELQVLRSIDSTASWFAEVDGDMRGSLQGAFSAFSNLFNKTMDAQPDANLPKKSGTQSGGFGYTYFAYNAALHQGAIDREDGMAPPSRIFPDETYTRLSGATALLLRLREFESGATMGKWPLSLQVRASGQYTGQRLLPLEQFVIGGYGTVRGHDPFMFMGDSGYSATTEIQLGIPWLSSTDNKMKELTHKYIVPGILYNTVWLFDDFQMVGFFDHGGVFINEQDISESYEDEYLSGAGFGIRLFRKQSLAFKYDLGFPLHNRDQSDDMYHYFSFTAKY
jgi:hemolysin activation/secretion protein